MSFSTISTYLCHQNEFLRVKFHFMRRLKCEEKMVVREVKVENIYPNQDIFSPRRVEELKKSIQAEGLRKYPTGLVVGDRCYLMDGHHRTVAQIQLGYKTIKVRAVEVSPEEWEAEIQRLKEKG